MKNSVAIGSLSGIHEYNVGISQKSNDQWGDISTSSFSNYGGVSEKPRQIQSTQSYLDKIQKKYSMNNNGHNDPHDFPIAQRVMTENKDGNLVERITIKNQNDATPPIFQQYEQNREQFRNSQRFKSMNNDQQQQQQYVSGRIQQTTENTNYGQYQNGNVNNNRQQCNYQNQNMYNSMQNSSMNNSQRHQQANQSDNNFVSMVPNSNYKNNNLNNSNYYQSNNNNSPDGFYANDNNNIY